MNRAVIREWGNPLFRITIMFSTYCIKFPATKQGILISFLMVNVVCQFSRID
jgi:hypothetical protein